MDFANEKIFKLKGKVRHYKWGGIEFIPQWLGMDNKENKPFAEYWMGAHSGASSEVFIDGKTYLLNDLIKKYPDEFLGKNIRKLFNELPYLFKILDVKDTLSIQVHPTKMEAEKGFQKEEDLSIPVNAIHRNYKDKNHKPEMLIALSEFWLLHGFLSKEKLKSDLQKIPEFGLLKNIFREGNYKELYEYVMNMPQQQVNEVLLPLIQKEIKQKKNNRLTKNDAGWWVGKYYENQKKLHEIDRGIFSVYFFNIIKLSKDEAVFQEAGIPHAYLEGQCVELMANSDNVLRGGLTSKHIDVAELLSHVIFKDVTPQIIRGEMISENEINYPAPVPDFEITKLIFSRCEKYISASASLEIWALMNGEINFKGRNKLIAKKGESVIILPGEKYIATGNKNAVAFKAFVL